MRKHHPYASIFPMMSDDEIAALAEDIRQHGQRVDVVIDSDGLVIDGRNRLAACLLAGVTPREYVFEGTALEKLHLVFSLNLPRRHLNESQRAMAAARAAAELQELRDSQPESANLPNGKKAARPRDVAAERMGVSPRSVQDAATVLQSGDAAAIAAVDSGETAVSAQAKRLRAQAAEERGEHRAEADSGAVVAASRGPRAAGGGVSREERAGIRRDVKQLVQSYPRDRRVEVATLITETCRQYLETGQ